MIIISFSFGYVFGGAAGAALGGGALGVDAFGGAFCFYSVSTIEAKGPLIFGIVAEAFFLFFDYVYPSPSPPNKMLIRA